MLQYIYLFSARKLALNLCYYQSEYKLTNCIHALQQSKDSTCTCIAILFLNGAKCENDTRTFIINLIPI
jgi:hypothetical protein